MSQTGISIWMSHNIFNQITDQAGRTLQIYVGSTISKLLSLILRGKKLVNKSCKCPETLSF